MRTTQHITNHLNNRQKSPPSDTVVTRFAPSPTGSLHLGGLRTALFNWLHARHHGGRFLLRIEDTDRERSQKTFLDSILRSLEWCGLTPDDTPVHQSQRIERHRQIAQSLLADGRAYRCYTTPEELADMRRTAREKGDPPRYDGRWRDRDASLAPKGVSPVLRLRTAQQNTSEIDDKVQGSVRTANSEIDDMVLLRSDGTPTYMLSAVIDDHDMGVNVIIRGDDHLTNMFRQKSLYEALGWDIPACAHIPLLHGLDGKKLSKRHGAVDVLHWREAGYLPEALLNYLLRLGWSHNEDEVITMKQAIEWFDVIDVKRAAARFDPNKLLHLNAHHMRKKSDDALLRALAPFLDPDVDANSQRLRRALESLKVRARTLVELAEQTRCFIDKRPLPIGKAAIKCLDSDAKKMLAALQEKLGTAAPWRADVLEAICRDEANRIGIPLKGMAQPLRAALTGELVSPPIFLVMEILGKEECIHRLADILPPT